jgi:protein-arginine kinase
MKRQFNKRFLNVKIMDGTKRILKQISKNINHINRNGNKIFEINQTDNARMNAILRHVLLTTVGIEKQ